MVLRSLIFTLCLVFITGANSEPIRISKKEQRLFNTAKASFKRGYYDDALSVLTRAFNLNDARTPSGALTLAAYSFEKLKKWNEAERIWGVLILNHYKESNRAIISAYKDGSFEGDEDVNEKMWVAYHRRAESLTQMILSPRFELSPKVEGLYKKTALMYAAILEETDYDDDSYDTIPERLESFYKEREAKVYRSSWFVKSSYVSWRDRIKLVRDNGNVINLTTTGEGTCVGGGWRYENDYWETSFNGCYALTSQTIGGQDPIDGITYRQKGVSSTAIMGGPSFLWKPASKQASLGINIPFVYRTGDYEEPNGGVLEDTSIFTYGFLLQLDWRLEKWGITTKFGKIQRFSSSFWSLGAMYSF